MQGDRGRIYFWSKLRHADLNSKEWIRTCGKKVPGSVPVSCNYIYSKIKVIPESVSNRATIFEVCVLQCGKGKEKRRKEESSRLSD